MKACRRLWRYIRPHWRRAAWAVATMCLVAVFNGTVVLLLKPIVDKIFIAKDFKMLRLAAVAVPLFVGLKVMLSYAQNYLMSWLGQKVAQELREELFQHLQDLPLDYYSTHRSGDVLNRVTGDLVVLQTALNSVPLYLIRDSMTVLALTASLFWLDWRFALLSLAAAPLTGTTMIVLSRKMKLTSLQSQAVMARLYQRFQESVQGIRLIRSFNYEEGALEKFREENASFFAPTMRYLRASALSAPLMELCGGMVVAFVLYFGGSEVIKGHLTPGAFFAFLGAFFAAYAPIKNVARSNSDLQRAIASAERIFQFLDEEPPAKSGTKPFSGLARAIRLEGVSFRYPGRREEAVRDVTLEIEKGSRVALVGPSGSGKTTICELIERLHEPTGGRVLFDDVDASSFDPRSLRERIGVVSQDGILFNDTVFENVAIGKKVVTLSQVERACASAGASDFIERLPEGYQTRLGDWGHSLSPGQRQKLAIARVVLKDPEILIFDEATANLDPQSERDVIDAIEKLFDGRTIVTIAHKLAALPRGARIIVLSQGQVVEEGAHETLMARPGLYRKLYDLQESHIIKP